MESYPSKPESIKNVYFAGQRLLNPGGTRPEAAETGRKASSNIGAGIAIGVFQGKICVQQTAELKEKCSSSFPTDIV